MREENARRAAMFIALAVGLLPVVFALYSGQLWEDALITLRHSRHLAGGEGLTYEAGQRIQGFTSPIVALLAAGGFRVLGTGALEGVVWTLRLLAAPLYATGLYLTLRTLGCPSRDGRGATFGSLLFVAGLYGVEPKSVAFSVNDMETAFVLAGLAASVWVLHGPLPRKSPWLGLAWALLMWARPDSAVYIALLVIALLLFPGSTPRASHLRQAGIAGLTCTLLYLPWFAFACAYYGSPVPQTIVAKSACAMRPGRGSLSGEVAYGFRMLTSPFLPPYSENGEWDWLAAIACVLGVVGALSWTLRSADVLTRRTSFAAFGGLLYLGALGGTCPWYFPPIFLLSLPALSSAYVRVTRSRRALGGALFVLVPGLLAVGWLDYLRFARVDAEVNERGTRKKLGEWLKTEARPDDRVFLECPGYIGFYSGLEMLDFPGLVSPDVLETVQRVGPVMARVPEQLLPEWLVLRPAELEDLSRRSSLSAYFVARTFDRSQEIAARLSRHPSAMRNSTFIVLGLREGAVD